MPKEKKEVHSYRIKPSDYALLVKKAAKEKRTPSDYVLTLILDAVEAKPGQS